MNICIYKYNFLIFKNQLNINKVALHQFNQSKICSFFSFNCHNPVLLNFAFFFHIRYVDPHQIAPRNPTQFRLFFTFDYAHTLTHRLVLYSNRNNQKLILKNMSQPTGAPQQLHFSPYWIHFNWEATSATSSTLSSETERSSGTFFRKRGNQLCKFHLLSSRRSVVASPLSLFRCIRKTHLSKSVTRIINTFNMREVERDLQPLNQLRLLKMNEFFFLCISYRGFTFWMFDACVTTCASYRGVFFFK